MVLLICCLNWQRPITHNWQRPITHRYDLYSDPRTGKKQPVPRHNEIEEVLAKHIVKELT
jgi:hypothetical protein